MYAIPLLAVLTVALIIDIVRTPTSEPQAAGATISATSSSLRPSTSATSVRTSSSSATPSDSAAAGSAAESVERSAAAPPAALSASDSAVSAAPPAVGELPAGEPFTPAGLGTFRLLPGTSAQVGTAPDVRTYTVEVEDGITPPEGDAEFTAFVDRTLADPRSWAPIHNVSYRRIDLSQPGEGEPSFRITLTSQLTVRNMCGFDVQIESSCYSAAYGRVVINDARWVRGALSYGGDLQAYRTYAINHEVGHALGSGHEPCSENGAPAPIMMQQTWSTSDNELNGINGSVPADGKVCLPNPWPNPAAATPAPAPTTGG